MRWFLKFERKKNFLGLLVPIRIKTHFHWKAQLFTLFKSLFKFFTDKSFSNITQKKNVSLGFETKFSDKPFIYIKKSSSLRIEPWGTPASTLTHVEFWPLRTTLLLNLVRKQDFMATVVSFENTLIKIKNIEKLNTIECFVSALQHSSGLHIIFCNICIFISQPEKFYGLPNLNLQLLYCTNEKQISSKKYLVIPYKHLYYLIDQSISFKWRKFY